MAIVTCLAMDEGKGCFVAVNRMDERFWRRPGHTVLRGTTIKKQNEE